MRIQIRNRGTAALSALTLVAATSVALVGLTGTAQAATYTAQSPAINGAPVNTAGISTGQRGQP